MNKSEAGIALVILGLALFLAADTSQDITKYGVNNVETVDGDTIEAEGDINATVRLLGVDTPETVSENKPREFGFSDTQENRNCLKKWGKEASEFTSNFTSTGNVSLDTDPMADRRGAYGRLLAYVEKDSEVLGKRLLEEGYARVYESNFTRLEEYRELQSKAKTEEKGLWQCS